MKNKLYTKSSTNRLRWMLFTICFVLSLFKVSDSTAQLTGVKTIPGSYGSLAAAITDLNAQGVGAGGVTINLTIAQTAPVGGYIIGGPTGAALLASSSAANPVIINGGGNTVTAFTPQATGAVNDAIIKLVGADFVTIQGFTLAENAGNIATAGTTAANNVMTEFGIALFYASPTDGARNNSIKTNTISLSRLYQYSVGVFSTTITTDVDVITIANLTAASGSNSNNLIDNNAINGVTYAIVLLGSRALTAVDAMDKGNTVTNNNITNFGTNGNVFVGASVWPDMTGQQVGVYNSNQVNNVISNNTLVSANYAPPSGAIAAEGIRVAWPDGATIQPTGNFTTTVNSNTITIVITPLAGNTGAIAGINFTTLLAAPGATITSSNNMIKDCQILGANAATNAIRGILNTAQPGTLTWDNNTFRGAITNATGGQTQVFSQQGTVQNVINIRDNKLGDATAGMIRYLRRTTATNFYILMVGGTAATTCNITGNDMRGVVQDLGSAGARLFIAFQPTLPNTVGNHTVSNNTITNINWSGAGAADATATGGGSIQFIEDIQINAAGTLVIEHPDGSQIVMDNNRIVGTFVNTGTCPSYFVLNGGGISDNTVSETYTNNNFSNITFGNPGNWFGWSDEDGDVVGPIKTVTGNVFDNITGQGTARITSLLEISFGSSPSIVSNNTFTNITCGGTVVALLSQGGVETFSNNTFSNITTTGTSIQAINVIFNDGGSVISKNKICNIQASNIAGSVVGIRASSGADVVISNNIVGDLRAPVTNANYAVIGILTAGSTPSKIYNNTVRLAGSGGANWGSAAVAVADTTYELNNNILVNVGAASGTGRTTAIVANNSVAHPAPSNYVTTSDRNDLFASTTYDDGTNVFGSLGTYAAFVAPADANSVSQNPPFLSTTCGNATFLHINPATQTAVESGGANVAGITNDIDGDIRQGNVGYAGSGTAPDIGADEFNGIPQPNCSGAPAAGSITGSGEVCSGSGTTLTLSGASNDIGVVYQWRSGNTPGGPYGTLLGTGVLQATGPLTSATYYQVTVTCTRPGGTSTTTAEFAITINPLPSVSVSPASSLICLPSGSAVTLTASAVGGTGALTYVWAPTRGLTPSTGVGNPISALPAFTTTYRATGTDTKGCVGSNTAVVNVSNTPTSIVATATPSSVCTGNTTQLNVTSNSSVPNVVPTYAYAASSGTFTSIEGGPGSVNIPGLQGDDVVANNLPIGFNFLYEGVTKTTFSVNSNGFLAFVALAAGAGQNGNLAAVTTPVIAPLWDDVSGVTGAADNATGRATYQTSGTVGNRVLTMEWKNWYWDFSNVDSVISFQVKLYEANGKVELVYDQVPGVAPTFPSASVGLSGATPGNFISLSNLSPTATASTLNETTTVADKPVSGQTYSFTPPVPIISYAWTPSAGLSPNATVQNPVATPSGSTVYSVTVTNSGCSGSATVSVSSGDNLTGSAATISSSPVCAGTTITITANFTGGGAPFTYSWDDGQGTGAQYGSNQSIVVNTGAYPTGSNTFTATITDPCSGNSTSSVTFNINPTPSASIQEGPTVTACTADGAQILHSQTDFGTTYQWKKDGTNIGGATNANLSVSTSGSYTVVISNGTCSAESAASVVTITPNATSPIALTPSNINGCYQANTSSNFTGNCIATTVLAATPDSAFRATTSITQGHGQYAFLDWTGNAGFINTSTIRVPVTTFPAGSTITNVTVTVGLAHNFGGEMLIAIQAPTTAFQNLFFDNLIQQKIFGSGGGTSSLKYTFQDGGAAIPATGQVASPGPYAPSAPLSNFNGLNPNGNWNISVQDVQQVNGGRLDSVTITITAVSPTGGVIWYNVPIGGSILATTSSFNPISQGGANTNTPNQVWDFYAECSNGGCSSARTHVTFTVGPTFDDGDPCTVDACNPANGNITHTPGGCGIDLYSNILLEGYYLGGGLLNNPLFATGISTNATHSDLITISAMQASPPYTLVNAKTDTLRTNGNVHVKFDQVVSPNVSYYLRITHRNHIQTWSKNPVLLTSTTTYTFSDAPTKAFGDNEVGTHAIPGQSGDNFGFALYVGDIWDGGVVDSGSQDGSVDATDFLQLDPHIQNGDGGYIPDDLNGDGSVDATDFLWLDPNVQNGVGAAIP